VNKIRVLEDGERVEELAREDLDELDRQALELVLLDELVQVGREQLEDEAQVLLVNERVTHAQNVVLVVRIQVLVQLMERSARSMGGHQRKSYHLKDRDLHHTLVEVRRLVLDNLDGHNLVALDVLALHDLAERALAKDVEDDIPADSVNNLGALT
jgi:hypothetical protein